MAGSLHIAEELVQEAFLRAMLHEELFLVLDKKQGRSWLYRTVKNLYIDCILLKNTYVMDQYFPLRAQEGRRYYAHRLVIIKDQTVDVTKLAQKQVQMVTKKLIVPERMIEDCVPVFDEATEFVVVPDGMKLVYEDVTLEEEVIDRLGGSLFVYGDLKFAAHADMEQLCRMVERLIVKGTVTVDEKRLEAFRHMNAEYDDLKVKVVEKGRVLGEQASVKLNRNLLENSPDGVIVRDCARAVIAKDVPAAMILEKLKIKNCAFVVCSEEQESAVAAVSVNVANIGKDLPEGQEFGGIMGVLKDLTRTKLINADSYTM